MEYRVEAAAGGRAVLSGEVLQGKVPGDWVMPLPLVLDFGDRQEAVVVLAKGAREPFQVKLPARPRKVELDPKHWVLSERTSTGEK